MRFVLSRLKQRKVASIWDSAGDGSPELQIIAADRAKVINRCSGTG
jgi:hypothetical protein